MGFEKGSLSFRMFYTSRDLGPEDVKQFAAQALPPLNTLIEDEVHGWVAGRHLLDRGITEENAFRRLPAADTDPGEKDGAEEGEHRMSRSGGVMPLEDASHR